MQVAHYTVSCTFYNAYIWAKCVYLSILFILVSTITDLGPLPSHMVKRVLQNPGIHKYPKMEPARPNQTSFSQVGSADRNKTEIGDALKPFLTGYPGITVLEVASGFGDHLAHLASEYPDVVFYPSEAQTELIDEIKKVSAKFTNVHDPLDVLLGHTTSVNINCDIDVVLAINLLHISSMDTGTHGLFELAKNLFIQRKNKKDIQPIVVTYGAFLRDSLNGDVSFASNADRLFDESLRSRNTEWGLRSLQRDIDPIARQYGFGNRVDIPMNKGNFLIIWKFLDST